MAQTQLEYERIIPTSMPTHVAAVAWVFISFGILAALEIIWSAINLRLSINLVVLGIFIGRGLLKRQEAWRRFGLGMTSLIVCMAALFLSVSLFSSDTARLRIAREVVLTGTVANILSIVLLLVVIGVCGWMTHVLRKAEVVDWFRNPRALTKQEKETLAEALNRVSE